MMQIRDPKGSCYFTIAISIERYLVICQPFYRNNCYYSSKSVIVLIIGFSVIYNIPKFFELEAVSTIPLAFEDNENGFTNHEFSSTLEVEEDEEEEAHPQNLNITSKKLGYRIAPTALMRNPYYYQIYTVGLNLVFNGLIPFVFLITLNILILKQVKKQNHLEEQSYHSSIATREGTIITSHSREQGLITNNIFLTRTTFKDTALLF